MYIYIHIHVCVCIYNHVTDCCIKRGTIMLMVIPAIACVVICIYIYWEHMLMDPKKMHVFWSVKFLEKKTRMLTPQSNFSVYSSNLIFLVFVFLVMTPMTPLIMKTAVGF